MLLRWANDNQEGCTNPPMLEAAEPGASARLQADESDAVIRALNAGAARHRTRIRVLRAVLLADALFMMAGLLLHRILRLPFPVFAIPFYAIQWIGNRLWKRASQRWTECAMRAAVIPDRRALGSLLDWIAGSQGVKYSGAHAVKGQVRSSLSRLLPRLTASDAGLLNARQQATLFKILDARSLRDRSRRGRAFARWLLGEDPNLVYATDEGLILAILGAMGQVGDESAMPAVRGLIDLPDTEGGSERIRTAAEDSLELIELRAQESEARNTLLRAASEPEATGGELLRPVADPAGFSDDPGKLLRPAD